MTERPILFSGPMVRAILDGRKSQTRRVVKPQPGGHVFVTTDPNTPRYCLPRHEALTLNGIAKLCHYGQPGDRLWVRETWTKISGSGLEDDGIYYRADGELPSHIEDEFVKWHPSIHMPRWASRIMLEITGIRVERLHYISVADAIKEGVGIQCDSTMAVMEFSVLWESIHGPGAWDANPWVWVIEFRRVI